MKRPRNHALRPSARRCLANVVPFLVWGGLAMARGAEPDDFRWSGDFGRPGLDNAVTALAVFEGDPVAGGLFVYSDSVELGGIARWNGSAWEPVGAGVVPREPGSGSVSALATYRDQIIAGGSFAEINGQVVHAIARWNGQSWNGLGTGLTQIVGASVTTGQAFCLVVYNDTLVVGGSFDHAGGLEAGNVACWNGSSWSALGGGLSDPVGALTISNGQIYAASVNSPFEEPPTSTIQHWDGTAWQQLGPTFNGAVHALATYHGQLVAAGRFSVVGSDSLGGVVRWDGTRWWELAPPSEHLGEDFDVRSLSTFGVDLVAGGWFDHAGSVAVSGIARWDGSSWNPLGLGVQQPLFLPRVAALVEHNGRLFVGGMFERAGNLPASHVASWNGEGWASLGSPGQGLDGYIDGLVEHEGLLVAAGTFTQAGDVATHHVAAWDGNAWVDRSAGLASDNAVVSPLVESAGRLYASQWTGSDTDPRYEILQWDGDRWQPYGPAVSEIVRCMVDYQGSLVIGGELQSVMRFNGSDWEPLGEPLRGFFLPRVTSLVVSRGVLYMGGSFERSGNVTLNNVARWDGTAWLPLGAGLTDLSGHSGVRGLIEYQGGLLAVGSFTASSMLPLNGVAFWDGSSWNGLGSGLKTSGGSVASGTNAFANGRILFVTGAFDRAGAAPATSIARWDGSAWSALGSGIGSTFGALATFAGDLYVGGAFRRAGNKYAASIARWRNPNVPVFVSGLTAQAIDRAVVLEWTTTGEPSGLQIERGEPAGDSYTVLTPEPLACAPRMRFVDTQIQVGDEYVYRLLIAEPSDRRIIVASTRIRVPSPSLHTVLLQPFESPDGTPIRLRYTIGAAGMLAHLTVYDVTGREVWSTPSKRHEPGTYERLWTRETRGGIRAARGVYFVHLEADEVQSTRKLVLVRP